MSLGIDYSWARPGGANIKSKGYTFVCRYLSNDTTGKTLGAAELSELRGNGLDVVVVWESKSNRALDGYSAGVADAQSALSQANALGFPSDSAIYFAVDFDEADNSAQNNAVYAYFSGVASVLPVSRIGVYGGYYVVERVAQHNLATWLWQTLAWSGGQVYPGVHIYQNGKSDFSGGADIDEARQSNIGAWKASESGTVAQPAVSQPPVQPVSSGNTYTVQSGDNMSVIAQAHGLTLSQLESYNPQVSNPNLIKVGEVLNLGPAHVAQSSGATQYAVQSGDTMSSIAAHYGMSLSHLETLNPQITNPNVIYPGEVLNISGSQVQAPAPTQSNVTYVTIQSGQTLSGLASKYGTSVAQLVTWNKSKYPSMTANYVQAGWSIRVR